MKGCLFQEEFPYSLLIHYYAIFLDVHSDSTLQPYQISVPQFLLRNKLYYIEGLLKQGPSNDRFLVGMKMPNGTLVIPIGNEFLRRNITKDCEYLSLHLNSERKNQL